MPTEISVLTKITHHLLQLHQQRATGKLVITQDEATAPQWQLYFYLGRLVYATGGLHPVRRWRRALRYHCPDLYQSNWLVKVRPNTTPWEADILNQAIQQGLISSAQAKAIIHSIVQEVVFSFLEHKSLKTTWNPSPPIVQRSVFLSVEQVIQDTSKLREEWRTAGLGSLQELMLLTFSPDLAPMIQNSVYLSAQVSPAVYTTLSSMMQGHKTFWDIASQMQRPLASVIRSLMPFIHQGTIGLKEIPDLPLPYPQLPSVEPTPEVARKLIACIDDSPAISRIMGSILQPPGYEVLSILNPLQGIAILLDKKPDLIFLDLVMPNTNGYELCTFLRKTSAFQSTPIIILTGHDGVIDRVRAKMAGSSEFLAKPPDPLKVLQMVQKYLGEPLPRPESRTDLPTSLLTFPQLP